MLISACKEYYQFLRLDKKYKGRFKYKRPTDYQEFQYLENRWFTSEQFKLLYNIDGEQLKELIKFRANNGLPFGAIERRLNQSEQFLERLCYEEWKNL